MWLADNWKDYEVIDCSKGEKLERWGDYILVRPDPQVIWDTPRKEKGWHKMNAHYHRSKKGGGEWEFFDLPQQWSIHYRSLTFQLKPFSFKHTGLFPEQAANWDWFSELIKNRWCYDCCRSSRCIRYPCRRFKGYGYLGQGKCCFFRSCRCTNPLDCR